MRKEILKGVALVLGSALCFSTGGTFQALAPEGATPVSITLIRMLLGFLFLFIWCLGTGKLSACKKRIPFRLAFMCSLWILCSQLAFFYGMTKVGVATGTVVDIGSTPIWTAILAWIFFRKPPQKSWYVATALAVAGLVLINGFSTLSTNWYLLFPLFGGLCYAGYVIFSSELVQQLGPELSMMVIMGMIATMLLPAAFIFPIEWSFTSLRGIGVSLGLGIVTAGVAFTLLLAGLKYLSPPVAATLCLAEPMGAAALGIFLLNEPCPWTTAVGILLILLSILATIFSSQSFSDDQKN